MFQEVECVEERSYDGYDEPAPERPNYLRLILASIVIILVAIGLAITVAFPPYESELYFWIMMSFLLPMACLASCTACAWGRGRQIAPTDVKSDERVFEEMHLRASRAIQMGIDWYRCPECNEAFDIANAKPIDDKVFLCPFCDSRLFLS